MKRVRQGLTVLLSLSIGLAIGLVLALLAVPALKYEIVEHANLLTRVLAYGFLLVPIAVVTVLKSPYPVTHTTGLVAGATTVLALSTITYTGTPMPYLWLAAATLFGCAAARIMKNERVATPSPAPVQARRS
jgi:membrane protein CcdC involved in cytochrome C biogenesis